MSNFLAPKYRAMDDNGAPISGATLHFYVSGATTPRATYPTMALAIAGGAGANANPVVSDSDGWFGRIFLQPDYTYTVVLKDAAGVTIWTQDDVASLALDSSAVATRLAQIASNPMDYGAAGNGIANDVAAVQAAINAATGVVDLLGKTYKCDSAIAARSGITIRNGALDFSGCVASAYLYAIGAGYISTLLTANASPGDATIAVTSVSGIVPGDLLRLQSYDTYGASTGNQGEIVRVSSVAGLNVSLVSPVQGTYTTANAAKAFFLTPKTDVVIDDVEFTASPIAAGSGAVIDLSNCDGVVVRNCRISGPKGFGIKIESSVRVNVSGCVVENGGSSAVGIRVESGCSDVFIGDGSSFAALAYGVVIGLDGAPVAGVQRNVSIDGCVFEACTSAGVYVGILAQHVRISGCLVRAVNPADCVHLDQCDDVRIYGNTLSGGDYGVDDNTVTNLAVSANNISGQTTGAIRGSAAAVLSITASNGNQAGIIATGHGTGDGLMGVGGASDGDGVTGTGGGTTGIGVRGVAATSALAGVQGEGGATSGAGVRGVGNAAGSTGVHGVGGSSTGHGVTGNGTGSGAGLSGTGGATDGIGVVGIGGATDGVGVVGQGTGSGAGVAGAGGSSGGPGVSGDGTGVGTGVVGTGGATDGAGLAGYGGGTAGRGVHGVGGSGSSIGVYGTGGASGVNGHSSSTGGSVGVLGTVATASANDGVKGVSNATAGGVGGYGVHGVGGAGSSQPGFGVVGEGPGSGDCNGVGGYAQSQNSYGVYGSGLDNGGYGVVAVGKLSPGSGDKSPFSITPQSSLPTHASVGDLSVVSTKLYICTVASTTTPTWAVVGTQT